MTKWTRQNADGTFQTLDDNRDTLWDFFMWWWLSPERAKRKAKRRERKNVKTKT